MKLIHFGLTSGLAALMIATSSLGGYAATPAPAITPVMDTYSIMNPVLLASLAGQFTAGEAPTTGRATIINEDGQYYLEIDAAFSTTDQAPDLHVLLDTVAVPPSTYEDHSRYINLGSLKAVTGGQRYPIPASIRVSDYSSVVIWCRMANATIGYATLAAQ